MIKWSINYMNLNNEEVETFEYFHLSKAELMELQFAKGGLEEYLKKIVAAGDGATLISTFKEIILMSYGVKTEDGEFKKSKEATDAFAGSQAFDALFWELVTNDKAAVEFINGVVPKGLEAEMDKIIAQLPDEPEDDRPAWVKEDRDPTRKEFLTMTQEQKVEAFNAKMSRNV